MSVDPSSYNSFFRRKASDYYYILKVIQIRLGEAWWEMHSRAQGPLLWCCHVDVNLIFSCYWNCMERLNKLRGKPFKALYTWSYFKEGTWAHEVSSNPVYNSTIHMTVWTLVEGLIEYQFIYVYIKTYLFPKCKVPIFLNIFENLFHGFHHSSSLVL